MLTNPPSRHPRGGGFAISVLAQAYRTKIIRELFRPALARWKEAAGGEDAGSCEEQGEKFLHRASPPKGWDKLWNDCCFYSK